VSTATVIRNAFDVFEKFGRRADRDGQGEERAILSPPPAFTRADFVIAAVLGGLAVALSIFGFQLTRHAYGLLQFQDIWFQADIARVVDNMTNAGGSHWRTAVHPVSSILLYPFGALLTGLGLSPLQAARLIVVGFCALNPALLFFVLRQIALPRGIAALFAVLFIVSASTMFWSSVVELYPIGCFSLLPPLFLLARRASSRGWWIVASALSLSITVTNWMVGLVATALRWNFRAFLFITLAALAIVSCLSVAQALLFKDARIFLNPHGLAWDAVNFSGPNLQRRGYLEKPWNPLANLQVLYIDSAVTPPIRVEKEGLEYVETNQGSRFLDGSYGGPAGLAAWVLLLALGIAGAIRNRALRPFFIGVGLMLLGNGILHSLYGQVTFLYSMHVIPLLTILAAASWFGRGRWLGVGLAAIVITAGGWSNWVQLHRSADLAASIARKPCVSVLQAYYPGTPGPNHPWNSALAACVPAGFR
jgi:hypothetical protein